MLLTLGLVASVFNYNRFELLVKYFFICILCDMKTAHKIFSLSELEVKVGELKKQGKKIVATNGAFDVFHIGQKILLEESKLLGDILVVGINSDASVRQYKSKLRPIIPERERAEVVAALACVDYVHIFGEKDPGAFLKAVHPDVYTKGGDYTVEQNIQADFVRENVDKVIIIPGRVQSTTNIIEKILKIYKEDS